jgi:PD-(D/E)XK nuclease superfamily protein
MSEKAAAPHALTASALGPAYTKGKSYRARAEARQREYRSRALGAPHGEYGHFLSPQAAEDGYNFVHREAREAALARQGAGKGVAARTFENMLSSQAMCFNIFAPLCKRLDIAAEVLRPFIPGLTKVTAIQIEYTPAGDVFNDQSALGGVDCDLLIEGETTSGRLLLVVETKFVEREFSVCGYRKAGRAKRGQAVCPDDVGVRDDRTACLYVRNKGYGYWRRSDQLRVLADDAVHSSGCPFRGNRWQLWVNLVLAHTEAADRAATDVRFAVCSSSRNTALLGGGEVLDGFRSLLRQRQSVQLIDLDLLLERTELVASAELREWSQRLVARYHHI